MLEVWGKDWQSCLAISKQSFKSPLAMMQSEKHQYTQLPWVGVQYGNIAFEQLYYDDILT